VSEDSDDGGLSLQLGEFSSGELLVLGVLLGVLGEGFPLRLVPLLIKSSTDVVAQMSSPDASNSSKSTGGGCITDNSNDDHGRGLEDRDDFDDFLLVNL